MFRRLRSDKISEKQHILSIFTPSMSSAWFSRCFFGQDAKTPVRSKGRYSDHPGHGRLSGHHSFGCPSAPASAAIPAVWHPSSPCCFASRCSSSGSVLSHFLWSHFGAASAFTSTIRDTIRVRSARICPPGSARPGGATTPRAWRGRVGTRDASMKCRGTSLERRCVLISRPFKPFEEVSEAGEFHWSWLMERESPVTEYELVVSSLATCHGIG